jgi:lipopolysaccharide biosynthesis protein
MTSPSLARRARSALFVALRAVFRAIPLRESTRDAVRSKLLRAFPTVRPLPAQGQVTASVERRPRVRADERCIGYVEYSEEPLPDPLPATLVAFYLPQFHTIPENDEWWGKGFTEWRNVARALPQFEGHLQPRLPGDLGFYDLRNPQVMRDQAKLAKTYGLSAFCFYFYWFGGKTLLEEPLRNWLADKSIDFQYCLCWANENWTRRWDGRDDEILIAQKHSPEDDLAFIEYVADYLRDPRYLRVDGKPMLLLYRPMLLPDPKATAERWRAWCRENGVGEIHLVYVESFDRPDPRQIGFNAAVEFPPNLAAPADITSQQVLINPNYRGAVTDWREMRDQFRARLLPNYTLHRAVCCSWDNESRRPGAGRAFLHATPESCVEWLRDVIKGGGNGPVFINAWNEWAEAATLEPDTSHGYAWLDAVRRSLITAAPARAAIIVHCWHAEQVASIAARLVRLEQVPDVYASCRLEDLHHVRSTFAHYGIDATVEAVPNLGRDVLPFLQTASRLRAQGYNFILKLHTKRSMHRPDGDSWRGQLFDALLDPLSVKRVIAAFELDPTLGMVGPKGHFLSLKSFEGGNRRGLELLSRLTGAQRNSLEAGFFAGTMFWIRTAALAPLLDSNLLSADFELETGQRDGTVAHAVERLFAELAKSCGYRVAETSRGHLESPPQVLKHYPFAELPPRR